jgi:hypothetical protein
MKTTGSSNLFSSWLAVPLLAAAIASTASAQVTQPAGAAETANLSSAQSEPAALPQQQPATTNLGHPAKEGFWGHLNPFARKKWVKKQTDQIHDQLTELDEVNAKNAKDIRDVDGRSQAGIRRAQDGADAANQTATAAASAAQQADMTAKNADGHVTQLNGKVEGLDQYKVVASTEIRFKGGQPVLTSVARKKLDDLAGNLTGQHGYILELEAHSPMAGSAGIQSSARLGEAVKRYLVTNHEIPVYRLHAVALGNARSEGDEMSKSAHMSAVRIQIMENSLASDSTPTPSGMALSSSPDAR